MTVASFQFFTFIIFKKKEFHEYAKEHLVLMEVDFPNKKELPEEVKKQNEKLDKDFKIEGYPTLFLLDADGNKLTEDIGYREGGPEAYVAHLKILLEKKADSEPSQPPSEKAVEKKE